MGDKIPKSLAELFQQEIPEPKWLVDGLIPFPSCGFCAGPPKSYKTWLMLDLAVALATGQPYLGHKPAEERNPTTLYIAAEGQLSRLLKRFKWMLRGRSANTAEILEQIYVLAPPGFMLDQPGGIRLLQENIERVKPGLVVIDALSRIFIGDENSREAVAPILNYLRLISEEYETCILLVHHSQKSGEHILRGSSDFASWYDFMLSVPRINKKNMKCAVHVDLRDGESSDSIAATLKVDEAKERASFQITTNTDIFSDKPESLRALEDVSAAILALIEKDGPTTTGQIRKTLNKSQDQIDKALSYLRSNHRINSRRGTAANGRVTILHHISIEDTDIDENFMAEVVENLESQQVLDDDEYQDEPLSAASEV